MIVRAPTAAARLAVLELEREANASTNTPQEPYTRSFGDHIAAVYPKFPFTRHNTRLVEIGQRVGAGEIPRLLLMLPPRHFKSTIFSRFLPSWFIRRYPDRTWGQGAHSQPLAEEFGQAARDYFTASGASLIPAAPAKAAGRLLASLVDSGVLASAKAPACPHISSMLTTRSKTGRRPNLPLIAASFTTGGPRCSIPVKNPAVSS